MNEHRLQVERDAYKAACERAGVCMTCVVQAPDPYGCSDCLNTGFVQGDPYEQIKALEAEVANLRKGIPNEAACRQRP